MRFITKKTQINRLLAVEIKTPIQCLVQLTRWLKVLKFMVKIKSFQITFNNLIRMKIWNFRGPWGSCSSVAAAAWNSACVCLCRYVFAWLCVRPCMCVCVCVYVHNWPGSKQLKVDQYLVVKMNNLSYVVRFVIIEIWSFHVNRSNSQYPIYHLSLQRCNQFSPPNYVHYAVDNASRLKPSLSINICM